MFWNVSLDWGQRQVEERHPLFVRMTFPLQFIPSARPIFVMRLVINANQFNDSTVDNLFHNFPSFSIKRSFHCTESSRFHQEASRNETLTRTISIPPTYTAITHYNQTYLTVICDCHSNLQQNQNSTQRQKADRFISFVWRIRNRLECMDNNAITPRWRTSKRCNARTIKFVSLIFRVPLWLSQEFNVIITGGRSSYPASQSKNNTQISCNDIVIVYPRVITVIANDVVVARLRFDLKADRDVHLMMIYWKGRLKSYDEN